MAKFILITPTLSMGAKLNYKKACWRIDHDFVSIYHLSADDFAGAIIEARGVAKLFHKGEMLNLEKLVENKVITKKRQESITKDYPTKILKIGRAHV